MQHQRARWSTRLGFVLAASGSAIGLGNVVFFGARAYQYGAGAFYLPYLLALFVVGIPILALELGLGTMGQRSLPMCLREIGGRWGELAGWFAILNAAFVTLYYTTILAWVTGMLVGSFGPLWRADTLLPAFEVERLANPGGFFFAMLSSPLVLLPVALVWVLNYFVVRRSTRSIEPVVRVFVPLMWLFMGIMIVRGLTLPNGVEGVYLLFEPDLEVMRNPEVWRGAVSQIFFSVTLGFGVMTAYASYLPKDSNSLSNGVVVACLNCGFEYIAGIAIFTILVALAIVPQASTLSMIFFVMPQGIAELPTGTVIFGLSFFLLLLLAGLSSSVSLVEALLRSFLDKFDWPERRTLLIGCVVGFLGSVLFTMPLVVDRTLAGNATLGLSLVDIIDHWAFSHGLLLVGLAECLLVGWGLPAAKLRQHLEAGSGLRIPAAFDWLFKAVIPIILGALLVLALRDKLSDGLYGADVAYDRFGFLPIAGFLAWIGSTSIGAAWLTWRRGRES